MKLITDYSMSMASILSYSAFNDAISSSKISGSLSLFSLIVEIFCNNSSSKRDRCFPKMKETMEKTLSTVACAGGIESMSFSFIIISEPKKSDKAHFGLCNIFDTTYGSSGIFTASRMAGKNCLIASNLRSF